MDLSQFIIQYRTEHGLSQRRFAALCGLSNSTVSLLEKRAEAHPDASEGHLSSIHSATYYAVAKGIGMELE